MINALDQTGLAYFWQKITGRLATKADLVNGKVPASQLPASGGGGDGSAVPPMTEITWSELKALRDGGNLTPGMQYRITDYNTIVTGYYDLALLGAQGLLHYGDSAGHAFDVIVTADDDSTLNENARAALHAGDTYFANSDLAAWELKYCLDNDATRFSFANASGKGVVYWMKDEFDNEAGYDFKNWRFVRYALKLADAAEDYTPEDRCGLVYAAGTQDNRYGSPYHVMMALMSLMEDGKYTNPFTPHTENGHADYDFAVGQNIVGSIQMASIDATYKATFGADLYYTFDYFDTTAGTHSDMTLGSNGMIVCRENKIAPEVNLMSFYIGAGYTGSGVGCIVVESNSAFAQENNSGEVNASGNVFKRFNFYNTFGNNCDSNEFGDYCNLNTVGNDFSSNTVGNDFSSNTVGNDFRSNTVGNYFSSNTVGNENNNNEFESNMYGCEFTNLIEKCVFEYGTWNLKFVDTIRQVTIPSAHISSGSEVRCYDVGSQGVATIINRTGYGQETAVSTTDGGQTWTAA